MPELPEVEIVKRSLLRIANKAKIKDIKVFNKKLRYKISNDFSEQLINEKIIIIDGAKEGINEVLITEEVVRAIFIKVLNIETLRIEKKIIIFQFCLKISYIIFIL